MTKLFVPKDSNNFPFARGPSRLLVRGEERYKIFCTPLPRFCRGDGNGMVAMRGMKNRRPAITRIVSARAPNGYFLTTTSPTVFGQDARLLGADSSARISLGHHRVYPRALASSSPQCQDCPICPAELREKA